MCRLSTGLLLAMQALEKRQVEVLKAVRQVRTHAVASRRPLVRRNATKNPEFKLFNPRFEEDFVAGKNYDPDRCCAHLLP